MALRSSTKSELQQLTMRLSVLSNRHVNVEWLLLALTLLLVGLALCATLRTERQHIAKNAQERLDGTAQIIGVDLANRLIRADRTLRVIINDPGYWTGGHERTVPVAAQSRLQELNEITGLRLMVLDASGRAVNSNVGALLGRNFSHRDYFKNPRKQPDKEMLYVSPPFKGLSGLLAVTIARVKFNAQGAFDGVVLATLDLHYSNAMLSSLLHAPDVMIVLLHGEGQIFHTMPERPELEGKDFAILGTFFSRHRDSGEMVSALTGPTDTTGEQRMMALRTIRVAGDVSMDQPLIVSVSRSVTAVFADWLVQAWLEFGGFMLFALMALYALGLHQSRRLRLDALATRHANMAQNAAERLMLATRAAQLGMWELDLASNELCLDAFMFNLYGFDRSAPVEYATWRACILPEDLSVVDAAMQASIQDRSQYETTFRIRRGDGEIRVMRVVAKAHYDKSGRPEKIIGINEDISALWQIQSKLRSRRLEAMGTLAAGIAHDFNNILGSIIGFAEMTADALPDESSAKQNVAHILTASFRARDLVARMLCFAGQSPAQPVLVDVVAQVRDVLALLRASLRPSVQLSFQNGMDEASAPVTILADPTEIQQIVMNLCINAADAIDHHGIISICLDPTGKIKGAPPNLIGGICLRVTDNGSGIKPEVLKRVFDPFFTTKEPGKGSGLGLSVVYGIVTDLGGVIEAQSRTDGSNTGSEFQVFLPVEKNTLPNEEMHRAH